MKELFEEPKFDVIFVDDVDIITTSGESKIRCCEIEEVSQNYRETIDLDTFGQ